MPITLGPEAFKAGISHPVQERVESRIWEVDFHLRASLRAVEARIAVNQGRRFSLKQPGPPGFFGPAAPAATKCR